MLLDLKKNLSFSKELAFHYVLSHANLPWLSQFLINIINCLIKAVIPCTVPHHRALGNIHNHQHFDYYYARRKSEHHTRLSGEASVEHSEKV